MSAGRAGLPGFPPERLIAIHILSFSAITLRDPKRGWTGPLVAHGVTATVGNVEEPYLELTHNPALFLLALLNGKTAGEAAAFSCPALSWQTIFVRRPALPPFLHALPAQLEDLGKRADPPLAYAVLRAVRRFDADHESDKADALLAQAFPRLPVLALAREILDREIAAGKPPSFRAEALARIEEAGGLTVETAEEAGRRTANRRGARACSRKPGRARRPFRSAGRRSGAAIRPHRAREETHRARSDAISRIAGAESATGFPISSPSDPTKGMTQKHSASASAAG